MDSFDTVFNRQTSGSSFEPKLESHILKIQRDEWQYRSDKRRIGMLRRAAGRWAHQPTGEQIRDMTIFMSLVLYIEQEKGAGIR
jgi:hypothetical protein